MDYHVVDVSQILSTRLQGLLALTAKIRSRQSIAAILSPSESLNTSGAPEALLPNTSPAEDRSTLHTTPHPPPSALSNAHRPLLEQRITQGEGTTQVVGAGEELSGVTSGQQEGTRPAKMARSSIACARCRRSKIKCMNNGTGTICVPCHQNNRECTYPPPAPSSASSLKRADHPSGTDFDGESETKRARKRESGAGGKHNFRIGDDPLATPPITFNLWRDIYTLFMLHYSTDLPFLHEATFFDRITKMQETGRRSRETELFLLGMLSLTARFVPELVSHQYPHVPGQEPPLRSGDALNPSEYYASILESRLDAVTMARPSLDTIQALLMLGLHSWGMCRGMRSWMWVGNATR